ncbi:MAG: CpaF family protein [Deltaproteobacteria bacterium]|nr:MAG: CpaF family protein [Deltaproteobacteria bacterium]
MGLLDRVRDREGGGQAAERRPEPSAPRPAAAPKAAPKPGPVSSRPISGGNGRPALGSGNGSSRLKPKGASSEHLKALKVKIHSELIERLDLAALGSLEPAQAGAEIRSVIVQLLEEGGLPLSREDRRRLEAEITSEVLGFGPLDPLLKDDTVSDILVNSAKQVYVERKGKLELTDITFRDDEHLIQIIDRIVSQVGRRVDTASPMVDARLPDGSRVNAIIPPIALDGPALSIRRFGRDPYHIQHLIAFGSMTREMAEFFEAIVKSRLNIIVSGGTGSGKTTLLNCLSSFIPENERVVTIEDAAELQLQQPHIVRLETRPPNLEGKGEITTRDLVRNCLRMRPDRIVVGEVRGGETLDMLQAMNTGHDGSITTLHANSPRDCLSRLEMMILMAGVDLPVQAMRQQISSAVNIIIQQARLRDGTRKVTKVTEITGMEGDTISSQDIFEFVVTGIDPQGKVEGHFRATGIRPKCAATLESCGFDMGPNFFSEREL